jgi:anti-anti-sigma factor
MQNNQDKGISLIKHKINENAINNMHKVCTVEYQNHLDLAILNVNLERATLENVSYFNEYIKAELDLSYTNFILNLSSSLFIDSTFLGAIVRLLKQISAENKNLCIVLDFEKIKILSPVKQLHNILQIYPTIGEAIKNQKL